MIANLTIIKYPRIFIPFAILSMAVFHLPLLINRRISFYKLMGSGKGGSFSKKPDLQQWAIFTAIPDDTPTRSINFLGSLITRWIKLFKCTTISYFLQPISGHGTWDKKAPFGNPIQAIDTQAELAVLTRATIKLNRLKEFWKHVPIVSDELNKTAGLIRSYGIGEIPLIKQATFSIWESQEAMKHFAYQLAAHKDVVEKTRKRDWYSEEMFIRFKILNTLEGIQPSKL